MARGACEEREGRCRTHMNHPLAGRRIIACFERATRPCDGQHLFLCAIEGSVKPRLWLTDDRMREVYPRAHDRATRGMFDAKWRGVKPRIPSPGEEDFHIMARGTPRTVAPWVAAAPPPAAWVASPFRVEYAAPPAAPSLHSPPSSPPTAHWTDDPEPFAPIMSIEEIMELLGCDDLAPASPQSPPSSPSRARRAFSRARSYPC